MVKPPIKIKRESKTNNSLALVPYTQTPIQPVRRSERIRLSVERSLAGKENLSTTKPSVRRSLPASKKITNEVVRLDEFSGSLNNQVSRLKKLVNYENSEDSAGISKKRSSLNTLTPLNTLSSVEEQFLASKKLRYTSTPKNSRQLPKTKNYFDLKFWMSKPKPWLKQGISKQSLTQEEHKINLNRVIRNIESMNAYKLINKNAVNLFPTLYRNSEKRFLKRNVAAGKLAHRIYEKMMMDFVGLKRKEKRQSLPNRFDKENILPESNSYAYDDDTPSTSTHDRTFPDLSLVIRNDSMANRNGRFQPIISAPNYDIDLSRDKGHLMYLQRMVEVTHLEKERSEAQLAQAQAFHKMATQEHSKAMKKYIETKRKFDSKALIF